MILKELLESVELPKYHNNFTKGDHKNGNYAGIRIYQKLNSKDYKHYDINNLKDYKPYDINNLEEDEKDILDMKVKELRAIVLSSSRYGANAGLEIIIGD